MQSKTDARTGIRFYPIEPGFEPPSVTTAIGIINKPPLLNWAVKEERELVKDVSADLYLDLAKTPPMSKAAYMVSLEARLGKEKAYRKKLRAAADIGTQAHALIEWNLRKSLDQEAGAEPRVTDKALWSFMVWEDWRRSVEFRPVAVEQVVWSREHGYAGKMDLLAYISDVLTVCDWKTGKAVYWEAELQSAAYAHAVKEMGHGDPQAGLVLRLPKVETNPNFEAYKVGPFEELFPTFLHALALWRAWYADDQKRKEAWKKSHAISSERAA